MEKINPIKFGKALKKVRKARGFSQVSLGRITGTSGVAISHFESGRRLPSLTSLLALVKALDVSVDGLLGRVPAGASGPGVRTNLAREELLKNFSHLSLSDQWLVAAFAHLLWDRKSDRQLKRKYPEMFEGHPGDDTEALIRAFPDIVGTSEEHEALLGSPDL